MKQHNYFVYLISNPSKTVLYTGVTNDLEVRLQQHKDNRGKPETFAGKFYCYKLLYYERYTNVEQAIEREKEIKLMGREAKVELIKSVNPKMSFLYIAS
ncbi:GIY-YIG nuclease family protein [Rufibacter latericius]|uniref:GIY-YIG nuclease family protein n=1 Tax=Rufibacter latericius TaxID=2487040 RepID=A0A3M9MD43_9BACT|nr:GIY-YIG nuclease family protein [Rufibacter latericius]RNI23434.1 GIY-YIG nuclease family protein [Rufibacter latericius]